MIVVNSPRAVKTLSANVRRLRKGSKASLSKFAEDTGISRRTLSRIEDLGQSGSYAPTMDTVVRLASALKLGVHEILKTKVVSN